LNVSSSPSILKQIVYEHITKVLNEGYVIYF
jgi:hypothetical protein